MPRRQKKKFSERTGLMQYEKYEQKVQKIENVMKFIFRHMKLIIFALSIVVAAIGTLLGTKGIITDTGSCPAEITYGEALGYRAEAFLSEVKYEYRMDGSDTWSEKAPTKPGKYYVRAAAKALFGYRHSEEEPFVINPKEITISISDKNVMYGEHPTLTAETAFSDKIVCTEFIYNENKTEATADASAIRIISAEGEDVTALYNFTVEKGQIIYTKRPITVTLSDKSKVYDGIGLFGSEFTVDSGSLANGDSLSVSFGTGIIVAGSIPNTGTVSITNEKGEDVTNNYNLTTVYGTLTVHKRELSIKTESLEVMYDGAYHANENYTVINGTSLAEGNTLSLKFTGARDAGTYDNSFVAVVYGKNGSDVTSNYSLSTELGKITVTRRPIIIATKSESKVYDGKTLKSDLVEVRGEYGLAKGDEISANAWPELIDVGTHENRPGGLTITSLSVLGQGGPMVTEQSGNYEITYEWGMLKVTKRKLSVSTKDVEFLYNGTMQSDSTLNSDNLAAGDILKIISERTVEDVGTYENIVSFSVYNEARDRDVSSNYEISTTYGTISIRKRQITVITPDCEWIYDGEYHYNTDITVGGDGLAEGQEFKILEKQTLRDVMDGMYNIVTVAIYKGDNDVSTNYEISYRYGTYKILKREITVYTSSDSKIYDDTALENKNVTVDNILDIHTFVVNSSSSIIYAGNILNSVADYDIIDPSAFSAVGVGASVKGNYSVTFVEGTLTIEPRPIILETKSASKVYDATALTAPEWLLHSSSEYDLIDGHILSAPALTASRINAGSTDNAYSGSTDDIKIFSGERDMTANYLVTDVIIGTLTVEPRPISISTNSINKTYDANICYDFAVNITSGTLCAGHRLEVASYPEFTDAIENGENKVEFYITDGSDDVTANYDISCDYGKVNIAKREISVSTNSIASTYDGRAHFDTAVNITGGTLCAGHRLEVTSYPEFTDAIENGENKVEFYITDTLKDVTANYKITYNYGKVNIAKREISVSTNSITLTYDGKLHSDGTVNITGGELCDGESITVLSAPQFKNAVANEENNVSFDIVNARGSTKKNYDITCDYGKVNISKRKINFRTESYSGVYDGKEHTNYMPVLTDGALCENHEFVITNYVTIKNATAGTVKNAIEFKIVDTSSQDDADLQSNYDITSTFGDINVSKREINVKTHGYSAVYDGYEHSGDSFNIVSTFVSGGSLNLCDGHSFSPLTVTSIKNAVSNIDNVITFEILDENGENADANYAVLSTEYGKINISKFNLTVKTDSAVFEYNGKAQKHESFTVVNEAEFGAVLYSNIKILNASAITNVWESPVRNLMEIRIYDDEGIDVTETNYVIAISEYGTLTVTKLSVTVTSKDAEKYYDSKPLTFHKWQIPAESENLLVEGHSLTIDFTGSQTEVGKSDNTYQNVKIFDGTNDVTENYSITTLYGTLTVKPRGEGGTSLGGGGGGDGGGGAGSGAPIFVITSDKNGKIYLKLQSYGNYNGKGFDAAAEYGELFGDYSAAHILPLILSALGEEGANVKIDPVGGMFALPYYTNGITQESDVYAIGDISEAYTLLTYLGGYYNTVSDNSVHGLSEYEILYRQFVYDNYLAIDTETYEFMQEIILAEGFDKNDGDIIRAVADYIKNSATYNMQYNSLLDDSENIVIAFLSEYGEGVCRHYAAAATMLYRALGIPARYTVGFMTDAAANIPSAVGPLDAHAWVEIYLDGIGWVRVEVTGSVNSDGDFEGDGPGGEGPGGEGPGGEGPGGEGPGGEGPGGNNPGDNPSGSENKITVKPAYLYKEYDGTPLYAQNSIDEDDELLQKLLSEGYWYEVTVSGMQNGIGISASTITSFILYDPDGNNVTADYDITKKEGTLEVRGATIKIYLYEKSFEYDGIYHFYQNDEWFEVTDLASVGVELVINSINIGLTDVGSLSSEYINENIAEYISYSVYIDGDRTVDYGENYRIMVVDWRDEGEYSPITVTKRQITVETDSAVKQYDGTPLTKNSFYISSGLLADGHGIVLDVIGSQTAVGESYNTVRMDSFAVYDGNGNDVTENYEALIKASGVLKVI